MILLPVLHINVEGPRRQAQCGKNQSQTFSALVAYQSSEELTYPASASQSMGKIKTANQAREMSYSIMGIIARYQSIPFEILTCPMSSRRSFKLAKFQGDVPPKGWGMIDGPAVHAFDWSAPADSSASRVISADRDPTAHVESVMACFGDAHVKKIKYASGSARKLGSLVTEGCDGQPVSVKPFSELGDDIYSTDGDGGDPLSLGAGDSLRAWVK